MPYQEKIAWLSLVGIAVCYGPYFAFTHRSPLLDQPLPNLPLMALFAAAAGGNAVWTMLGRLLVRMKTPRDERGHPDERDLAVDRRANAFAYYVLIGLALFVGMVAGRFFSTERILAVLHLGAAGAALGTVAGQSVSAGMSIYFFFFPGIGKQKLV